MNAGEFEVANVDGSMDVDLDDGVGTKAVQNDDSDPTETAKATKIITKTNCKFTHGSFDIGGKHAYILNKDRTNDETNYFSDKGTLANATGTGTGQGEDNWVGTTTTSGTTTVKYFVAMSWKMTFNYTFHSETSPVSIYFDYASSTMTRAQKTAASSGSKQTANGFRIAFLPEGGTPKVWGYRTGTAATDLHYVTGTGISNLGSYTATNYIPETNGTYTAASDATTAADQTHNEGLIERIATINKTSDPASIVINCVAWFEGTDEDVVSEAAMDGVSAKLNFYARSDYVAPSGD